MATSDAPLNVPNVTLAVARGKNSFADPPSAPPVFTTTSDSNSITAIISEPNGATSYEIRADAGAAQSGVTVLGLNASQSYSVEVRGINKDGTSAWSAPVTQATTAAETVAAPSAPPAFRTSVGANQIAAIITNTYGATRYNVRVDNGTAQQGHIKTGLQAQTPYSFQVQGENDGGVSAWSTAVSLTTTAVIAYTGSTPPERQFDISITGDGGTLGAQPKHITGILNGKQVFTDEAGESVYSNDFQYNARTCIKHTIKMGWSGGGFGGIVNFQNHVDSPSDLLRGDELWCFARMYIPSTYEFQGDLNTQNAQKFLRCRTYTGNESAGYNDVYLQNWRPQQHMLQWITEAYGQWLGASTFGKSGTTAIPRDQWFTVEYYQRFDNRFASEGGDPLVRVWINGVLDGEAVQGTSSERRTLKDAESFANRFNFLTWWGNDGSPKDQSVYCDTFRLKTSVPNNTDANGYPYIGDSV